MSQRNRHPGQRCPSCKSKAYVTATRSVSQTITERYYLCSKITCGHQFKTLTEITDTIVPPMTIQQQIQQELVLNMAGNKDES